MQHVLHGEDSSMVVASRRGFRKDSCSRGVTESSSSEGTLRAAVMLNAEGKGSRNDNTSTLRGAKTEENINRSEKQNSMSDGFPVAALKLL